MPCTVKKTFAAAAKARSHLLVQVKENQPGLLRKIEEIARTEMVPERFESIDKDKRSRYETRRYEVCDAAHGLANSGWDGLISHIIKVTRTTLVRRTKTGMWERREEVCYYVCSAAVGAEKAAAAIRKHWDIENRNHYVRDVSMLEDMSRIRVNPGIFARARSFALNILRANHEQNIADALYRNALDLKRPLAYRFK